MKRKILTLLFAAATVLSLSSVSVMAQTTSEQTSEQTLVSSGQNENREFDKNTLIGTVLSCDDETITLQTSPGRRGGRQFEKLSNEESADENLKAPPQTDDEIPDLEPETGQDQLTQTPPEKPDNGQEPKGEEKTVLITNSTLIYTQEDGTQTQSQLSDISEGMIIKVEMAEDSDMQSSQVTAQSITVSERKERPEKQSDTQTNNQENQSSVDTEDE